MPTLILTVAGWFGISPLRLIMYAALAIGVVVGAAAIRQHYINVGWAKHQARVEKQDNRAIKASREVQRKADECAGDSWWDVVTQRCKLEDAE
jgi:hypothetical protein